MPNRLLDQIETFLGIPYRWNARKAFANLWKKDDDGVFPPENFGWGWDLNFHALLKKLKPSEHP